MSDNHKVLIVPYNTTEEDIMEVKSAYPTYRIERADMLPVVNTTTKKLHWKDNLVKNGVRV